MQWRQSTLSGSRKVGARDEKGRHWTMIRLEDLVDENVAENSWSWRILDHEAVMNRE